jgi:predicted protein tyrosine phosphatase
MARFLCVCDGGNVRSYALAYVLHDLLGHEAIAVGRIRVTTETLALLCEWADTIVLMQPHMEDSVDAKFKAKLRCVDVGPDRWGVYVNPELLEMVKTGACWLTGQTLPPI